MDLLTRPEWGATAPTGPRMTLPALGVFCHHSVTTATANVPADMRDIERIGVSRFGRFSYSYCGHPTGVVAEGAGLTVGAHTADYNSRHFGFCLIGNYENSRVTDTQIASFHEWCRWQVQRGFLVPDFFIRPHRAVKSTACPGANTIARWDELTAWETQEADDMTPDQERMLEQVYHHLHGKPYTPTGTVDKTVRAVVGDTRNATTELVARVAALESAVAQLAGGQVVVDYAKVEAAAEKAVRDVLGAVDE